MRGVRAAPPPPPPTAEGALTNVDPRIGDDTLSGKIWVKDSQLEWSLATVISRENGRVRIVGSKKMESEIAEDECLPVNTTISDDATALHHLHEPGILYNLHKRYERNQIYSYMASALIAVNPFARIAEPNADEYITKSRSELTPHPNFISETCFKNLAILKKNQSVIISGESGAGKTETAKIVIKYLASRGIDCSSSSGSQSATDLYGKLQQLSPILESFGNAKTGRNGNSSRFGKFMKLLFSHQAAANNTSRTSSAPKVTLQLTGAMIETYMLEKSRVVYQSHGEGNFHIFYSLLQSAPASLQLDTGINFRIAKKLPNNATIVLEDTHRLSNVTIAFRTLGLSEAMINEVYKILVGILYLGNVTFEAVDSASGSTAKITALPSDENPKYSGLSFLKFAAESLGVDISDLRAMLTTREMETRGEKYTVPLTLREAEFVRDATTKAIYEALFNRIVNMANASLLTGGTMTIAPEILDRAESSSFIGVLDIFGFESFQINGFEQLLINYANEALQHTFNKQVFEKELQLFEEERIEITIGDCPNNQECVDLLSSKVDSILSILDSVSRQPQPSDERFCEELHKCFTKKKSSCFGNVHRKDMRNTFVVRHYASTVKYHAGLVANPDVKTPTSIRGSLTPGSDTIESAWIVKNNDSIPDALEALFPCSSLAMMRSLSNNGNIPMDWVMASTTASMSSVAQPKRRKSVMLKPTIAATFVKSMSELNIMLDSTTCHFIRCIKPNLQLVPNNFDDKYVVEQMRALGIVQACEVLKVSLPTRMSYHDLKEAFRGTVAKVKHLFGDDEDSDVLLISSLFKAYRIPSNAYRLGVTIAFFRAGQLAMLEKMLSTLPTAMEEHRIASEIEEMVRRFHTVRNEIVKADNLLGSANEYISELERKQQRIRQAMLLLPEHRGLDIPDTVALGVTAIETRMKSLRIKQSEHLKHVSGLETLILQLSSAPSSISSIHRTNIKQLREFGDALETNLATNAAEYQKINDLIDEMEEAHAKGDASKLQCMMDDIDNDYERIMDVINNVEKTLEEVKLQTERGTFDTFSNQYASIESELVKVGQYSRSMATNVQVAGELLKDVEVSAKLLNFSPVEKLVQGILKSLEQGGMQIVQQEEAAYQQYAADLNRAIAAFNSTIEQQQQKEKAGVAASSVKTEDVKATGTRGAVPRRSVGSLYSLKDLAEMKRNGSISLPSGGLNLLGPDGRPLKPERINTSASSSKSVTSSSAAALVTSLTMTTSTAGSATDISYQELPDGWKEFIDPKSQRPYYVNKATKERQWKRPTQEATNLTATSLSSASASALGNTLPSLGPTVATAATNANAEDKRRSKRLPPTPSSDAPLPVGWREVLDKKSGRLYYVNDETKARQWRRPESDPTSSSYRLSMRKMGAISNAAGSSNAMKESNEDPAATSNRRISRRVILDNPLAAAAASQKAAASASMGRTTAAGASATGLPNHSSNNRDRSSKRFDKELLRAHLQEDDAPPDEDTTLVKVTDSLANIAVDSHRTGGDKTNEPSMRTPVKSLSRSASANHLGSPSQAMLTAIASSTQSNSSFGTLQQETIAMARRASALLSQEDTLLDSELTEQDKQTISFMHRIGHQKFAGYLMKQSKLLGRWRKRYFVLDGNIMVYFDTEKEYLAVQSSKAFVQSEGDWSQCVKAEKILYLSGASIAAFTTTDLCFSISTLHANDPAKDDEWFLLAKSEEELTDWMRTINAHIHVTFCTEENIHYPTHQDYWDAGQVSVSFWRVPIAMSRVGKGGVTKASMQRRPVGIRTLPFVHGPRTGEGLFPGDIVEIVQTINESQRDSISLDFETRTRTTTSDSSEQQQYLRLAGDRGWVFENHPTGNYAILERVGGSVQERLRRYQYDPQSLHSLRIYLKPQFRGQNSTEEREEELETWTGEALSPGEEFDGIAEWHALSSSLFIKDDALTTKTTADGDLDPAMNDDDDDDEWTLSFVKLRDGRGWVQMTHPVTGGQLLTPI